MKIDFTRKNLVLVPFKSLRPGQAFIENGQIKIRAIHPGHSNDPNDWPNGVDLLTGDWSWTNGEAMVGAVDARVNVLGALFGVVNKEQETI